MPTQAATTTVGTQFASSAAHGASAASSALATPPLPVDPSNVDLVALIRPFTADALANGIATLVGALLGAMLAYALQRKFQRAQEFKSDLVAAHRLMFALLQQINTIVLIQRDHVFPQLKNPGRFLSIPAMAPYNTEKNVLKLEELGFLLVAKEGRAILHDFYLAQENFIEALNQLNLRSALHLEKIQPAMGASGIPMGSLVSEADLQRVLGVHLLGSIVNLTNNSIEALQRAFQRLDAVKQLARPYLVRRFGTEDFTDFDYPETYGLSEPSKSAKAPT